MSSTPTNLFIREISATPGMSDQLKHYLVKMVTIKVALIRAARARAKLADQAADLHTMEEITNNTDFLEMNLLQWNIELLSELGIPDQLNLFRNQVVRTLSPLTGNLEVPLHTEEEVLSAKSNGMLRNLFDVSGVQPAGAMQ